MSIQTICAPWTAWGCVFETTILTSGLSDIFWTPAFLSVKIALKSDQVFSKISEYLINGQFFVSQMTQKHNYTA